MENSNRPASPAPGDIAFPTTITLPENLAEALKTDCKAREISVDEMAQRLITQKVARHAPVNPADGHQLFLRFWTMLLNEMGSAQIPLPQNWCRFPLTPADMAADTVFTARGTLRICWVLQLPERAENVALFNALKRDRLPIEEAWGGQLSWEARPGHLACRLCSEQAADITQEALWPALQAWIIDRLACMETS